MKRIPCLSPAIPLLVALLLLVSGPFAPAQAQPPPARAAKAESLAEQARSFRDGDDHLRAIAAYRESLALDPKAEIFRELGDLHAERDMHVEAISAFRSAIAADPSLEPELRASLGEQLLWADRAREAIPLLSSVVANRPGSVEAVRHLALAYRWSDRLEEAEDLYRKLLAADPSDGDARKGLAETLLWQGRHRAAAVEFRQVLAGSPSDAEALTGLSRALLFQELPEEAAVYAERAQVASPGDKEARDQAVRVRERLARYVDMAFRASNDSEELSIYEATVSVHARPRPGLDMEGGLRQSFFRQGFPGRENNIDNVDSVDATGAFLAASYRPSPALELKAGGGYTRYDAGGFRPWAGNAAAAVSPSDTVRFVVEWERTAFDSILSLQNRVTADSVGLAVSKHFLWKTEIAVSAAVIYHHNRNEAGQDRENRGERFGIELTRRLYLKEDVAHVAGIVRLGWLGFKEDIDVGVFNPDRYATEEVGLDGRWEFLTAWEFHGTAFAGAQQEKGNGGGPTYSAEAAVDRKIGLGSVSVGGFIGDSNARGRGEGFRRYGGLLHVRIPF